MMSTSSIWRLPGVGLTIKAIERWGGLIFERPRVPELEPVTETSSLDRFVEEGVPGLWAGAACIDITPPDPEGMYVAGFGLDRICTGVRDPLYARCLVLRLGSVPFVLLSLDLIGLFANRVQRLRSLISRSHPASVWICSTHNHQSPDTLGIWGKSFAGHLPVRSGLDAGYMDFLEGQILSVVEQALEAARPARLSMAHGEFDRAGHWVHNERSQVLDRDMRVLQLDDEAGASIATVVQHACHPETLWSDNTRISADFCSVCCRQVEKRIGGTALYLNGALGAMVSAAVGDHTPLDVREGLVDRLGLQLGKAALRLVGRARRKGAQEPALDIAVTQVVMPIEDNRLYSFLHALGIIEGRDLSGGLRTEVGLARIGSVWLLGLPGEASPELGLELLARLPGDNKLLLGLANDEIGYLLPPEFFHDPAYAYEQSMSPGPMAATRIALGLERLMDLLGGFLIGKA
ncbi:MAG: neutral/alkaline non-lysosomal ceramidase N-terminal domain-containing protein [Deltaproteobacteria bacterium]|nr:neutral/alkaline non-lysosomal ceramidase N-terminal domain-containing protein [Deltaproteobacteria bacterium]